MLYEFGCDIIMLDNLGPPFGGDAADGHIACQAGYDTTILISVRYECITMRQGGARILNVLKL
jgi:hypothetical protein